ncbi:MAG: Lrp/AsnC family transcriptional regulator [Prevotella sp.]|nr:Lrp/AsnC family transcriptional regulator [Prevotella sp.]
MDKEFKPDKVDLRIMQVLQENARLTTKELAAKVCLSPTPVFERLKRLERNGYIKGYIALLDAEKLGAGFTVFCNVKMSHINARVAADFARVVADIPQVTECYNISGTNDYLLKILAPDMVYYKEFILNVLGEIEYIASVESVFVMDEVKLRRGIPLKIT